MMIGYLAHATRMQTDGQGSAQRVPVLERRRRSRPARHAYEPCSSSAAAVRISPGRSSTVPRPKSPGGGWDAQNHRLTFYCPTDRDEVIEAEMTVTSGPRPRCVDALRVRLLHEPRRPPEATG
jgi:hypothetical protein